MGKYDAGGEGPVDPPPPASFVGMISPFAQDTAPLKEEGLPPLSDRGLQPEGSATSSHKRTASGGRSLASLPHAAQKYSQLDWKGHDILLPAFCATLALSYSEPMSMLAM